MKLNVPQLILCFTDSDWLILGTATNVRMTVKISMEIWEEEEGEKNILTPFHFNLNRQAESWYISKPVVLNVTDIKLNFMLVNITHCKVNPER
jgi:hypothetical protein